MSKIFKRMKPIKGKGRIQQGAEKIPNEERLLELMAGIRPEHRLQLFDRIEPHLRFRLSAGFNRAKLYDMPYAEPGKPVRERIEVEPGVSMVIDDLIVDDDPLGVGV